MALFTDEDVVTLDDLTPFETALVTVASSHGINVETKIRLAEASLTDRLLLWLQTGAANDLQRTSRRVLGLSNVVVTPALKRWLCFDTLARFFAEAYNVQLNTRFQGKWTEYQQEANDASRTVFMAGLGMVMNPLPKPMMPAISVQDGTAPAESIFVQTTWVDGLGNESWASPINGQILSGAASIAVGMAEGAIGAPALACGWNVYASTAQQNLTRQNAAPIPVGSAWQLPSSGLTEGPLTSSGQSPDYYVTFTREIQRG